MGLDKSPRRHAVSPIRSTRTRVDQSRPGSANPTQNATTTNGKPTTAGTAWWSIHRAVGHVIPAATTSVKADSSWLRSVPSK